ncbi:hypothetical protein ABII15_18710 [Streptomyces sp. HUAS MG91]|uniref:Gram-positive cocci surface proteins LPxTG domain-containing protein n=1 Tax=Streptomyces tabacisoli TaxID=3156398 RepID=A0AAU8IUC7_9ACTN
MRATPHTRRVLRTATIAAGALAALTLAATTASADTGPAGSRELAAQEGNAPSHAHGYVVAPGADGTVTARPSAAPADTSGSALIAAGAGIAATGAASLGFALYRRDSER